MFCAMSILSYQYTFIISKIELDDSYDFNYKRLKSPTRVVTKLSRWQKVTFDKSSETWTRLWKSTFYRLHCHNIIKHLVRMLLNSNRLINGSADNEGGEIARKVVAPSDVVSIMNNALLKMKTQPRFLDYNPTGNSDKSLRSGGSKGVHPAEG